MELLLAERPIGDVQATILEDGAVLINVERQLCYRLDRSATFIWLRLCDGTPVLKVAREIAGGRGDLAPTVRLVESLHEELVQAGVLRIVGLEPNYES